MTGRAAILTVCLVVGALLAGCSGGSKISGTVTELEHEPARSETTCVRYDAHRKCVRSAITQYRECFEVEVDHQTDVCVDRATFERTQIGQKFTYRTG